MRILRTAAIAIGFLIFGPTTVNAETKRPFTVEDILRNEGIGEARVFGSHDTIIFERLRSLNDKPALGDPISVVKEQSELYSVCISQFCEAAPLLPQYSEGATWLSSISPSGDRFAFFLLEGRKMRLGVYDLTSKRSTVFDIAPQVSVLSKFNNPIWVDDDTLLLGAAPDGRQAPQVSTEVGASRVRHALRERAWFNGGISASIVRSGHPMGVAQPPPAGRLLRVRLSTGEVEQLHEGTYLGAAVSRDGRYLALARDLGRAIPISPDAYEGSVPFAYQQLIVLDLESNGAVRYACSACDVLPESMSWDLAGERLLYYARARDSGWETATYYSLDVLSAAVLRVLPSTVSAKGDTESGLFLNSKPQWLRGQPLVYAYSPHAKRSDWFLIQGEDAIPLTDALASTPPRPLYRQDDRLFFWSGGSLWLVTAEGAETLFSPTSEFDLYPARRLNIDGLAEAIIEDGALVLDGEPTAKLLLDLETNAIQRLKKPDPASQLLDLEAGVGVFLTQTNETQDLSLLARGVQRSVLSINDHLREIEQPIVVYFEYHNEGGDKLGAFLLTPQSESPANGFPVIVSSYPWRNYSGEWAHLSIEQMWSANPELRQVLVGAGYAVLFPSLPLEPFGAVQDRLATFPGNTIPAVNRANELGYIDIDRVGIIGSSYGSYSVAGTIVGSDLFKAAVTGAHTEINLFSFFGQDDIYNYQKWRHTESFLTGPPWVNPEGYVKNSPIFHLADLTTPWLMLQGDLDPGLQQSDELYSALLRLGKDAQLIRYWGEGHGVWHAQNMRHQWDVILDWFDYYLRGKKPE